MQTGEQPRKVKLQWENKKEPEKTQGASFTKIKKKRHTYAKQEGDENRDNHKEAEFA